MAYQSPPTTADVNIRNHSIKVLHFALGELAAQHPESAAAQQLWRRWLDFLHSDVYRVTPDASLYPIYKAFSQGYHLVWNLVPDPRPTLTPDVSVVTLLAEDLLENMDDFERALKKAVKAAGKVAKAVADELWVPLGAAFVLWLLLRR